MSQTQFKGVGVALVTPYNSNGDVDFPSLERIIEYTIKGGVDFLVSLGTTGEATALSKDECQAILDFTVQVAAERLPVVAGFFGGNNTQHIIDRINAYDLEGCAAIMSSSPSYLKPTQEGIFQHYMKIEEASSHPIIIYNVPGRTSSNIDAETVVRLAQASEKFVAIKDASGNLVQGMEIFRDKPAHLTLLSGDDPTSLPLIASGAEGVISVIANAFPKQFCDMIHAALRNDYATARAMNSLLLDLHPWLYTDGNPAGIKATLEILGYCNRSVRLPLVPVKEETFRQLVKEVGRIKVGTGIKVG